jgi:hypothetical protein
VHRILITGLRLDLKWRRYVQIDAEKTSG